MSRGGGRWLLVVAALAGGACVTGCTASRAAGVGGAGGAGSAEVARADTAGDAGDADGAAPGAGALDGAGPEEVALEALRRRHVDGRLGFQVDRPRGGWTLSVTEDVPQQGVEVPVVLRHESGATVVLQVAPAVATPFQYAESLARGLGEQVGVVAGDVEPLALSEGAVGFRFQLGGTMQGRVAVREGSPGRVFMLLATWPDGSPAGVAQDVDAIIGSVLPVHAT
jgi:hypothetical protein